MEKKIKKMNGRQLKAKMAKNKGNKAEKSWKTK